MRHSLPAAWAGNETRLQYTSNEHEMGDQMGSEDTIMREETANDARSVEASGLVGGSIEKAAERVEKDSGWQEVRGRRAEKRTQGGTLLHTFASRLRLR